MSLCMNMASNLDLVISIIIYDIQTILTTSLVLTM